MKHKDININPYCKVPYNWDFISGEKYWKIYDILYDDTISDLEKQARLCSTIEDIPLNDFYNLPINEATDKIARLSFLNDFKLIHNYNPKSIQLGGYVCNLIQAQDMTIAQFIDYQNFITKSFKDNYDKILSIFIIPKGKNYNEDYDITEIQSLIVKMNWRVIQSLLNFILTGYLKSLHHTLLYSVKWMKKLKGQEKQEMEQKILLLQQKIKDLMHIHISV